MINLEMFRPMAKLQPVPKFATMWVGRVGFETRGKLEVVQRQGLVE